MRNNYIVKILSLALLVLTGLTACKSKPDKPPAAHAQPEGHQEMAMDSSIITLTRAVNTQVVSEIPAITATTGMRIVNMEVNGVVTYDTRRETSIASKVGGRIERLLIRYNYQPVQKGQLIMEIYSPDLAAAQRELLMVARDNADMLQRAKQRLSLLGMQQSHITQVLQTGKVLYRIPVYSNSQGYILEKGATATAPAIPASSSATAGGDGMSSMGGSSSSSAVTSAPAAPANSPVMLREGQYVSAGQSLFTIYQASELVAEFSFPPQLANKVKPAQQLLFYPTHNRNEMRPGTIGLIEPVFKNGQNFMTARVYLRNDDLQVGQLLTGQLPIVLTTGWWLPKQAVWRSGNKSIVFKKEKEVYLPIAVNTGTEADGMVQVTTDLSNWQVAANASYLVDSESFIRTNKKAQE